MQSSSGVETLLPVEQSTPGAGGSRHLLDDHYKYEPLTAEDAVRILVLEAADEFDQCVFLRGYRMKERLRPLPPAVMKASADPLDFGRPDGDAMDPSVPVTGAESQDGETGLHRPVAVFCLRT